MRKPPLASQRRLSSGLLKVENLREFAARFLDSSIRQPRVRVYRFGKTGCDLAFALVEECRAPQPVLQRHRRVVGTWSTIGALDPGFAGQPIVVGVAARLPVAGMRCVPGEGGRGDNLGLLVMKDRVVAGLHFRRGDWFVLDGGLMLSCRLVDPLIFPSLFTPAAAARHGIGSAGKHE